MLLPGCASSSAPRSNYPKAWLQVAPGMSKEEVHALLGAPQEGLAELREATVVPGTHGQDKRGPATRLRRGAVPFDDLRTLA